MRSLDAFRGLTIIAMIIVNGAMVVAAGEGAVTWPTLEHAPWAGVTLADVVFPFFLFILGVAIPFALGRHKDGSGLDRTVFQKILRRAVILFLLGLGLNFISLLRIDGEALRWLGVLQRIGIVYLLAALIYMAFSWRWIAGIAATILLLYWPLALLPIPFATVDLSVPGANYISWFEREYLASHIYMSGTAGFDPEGLLSTLPATAQALLGVLAGLWIRAQADTRRRLNGLAGAGLVLTFAGFHWGLAFPMIKALWTSSYVVFTTGLALLALALLSWLVDVKGWNRLWVGPLEAFGLNAISAYILHILLLWMLKAPLLVPLYWLGDNLLSPEAASLPPVLILLFLTWLPIALMGWRRITIRI
jgi:predicted acyltransferase